MYILYVILRILFTGDFYFCLMCGDQIPDHTGKKMKILEVRRRLAFNDPDLLDNKTGAVSTAELGGDKIFATPGRKRQSSEMSSDGDKLLSLVDIDELVAKTKKVKPTEEDKTKDVGKKPSEEEKTKDVENEQNDK